MTRKINCEDSSGAAGGAGGSTAADTVKFKILLLGNAGVGKTSLSQRFVNGFFDRPYIYTIGIDFHEKIVELDGRRIKLQLWDTAGQERFRAIIRPYYRGASGILLVYDVTDEGSFASMREWMENIEDHTSSYQVIQKIILGNKIDLSPEVRRVTAERGKHLADHYDTPFFEVSAKEGTNVEEAFDKLTRMMLGAKDAAGSASDEMSVQGIVLDPVPVNSAGGGDSDSRIKKCCARIL